MKLPLDFKEPLQAFDREKVEYAIIGGYAYAFHFQPRATKDLDLLVDGSPENRARAARALADFGAPETAVQSVAQLDDDQVAFFGQPPLRVDVLRTIDGVGTRDALERAVPASWDGVPVRILALDDLIANKRAAGRPQDLVDVTQLERVKRRSRDPR